MSYQGDELEIPLGTLGMTGTKNPAGVRPGQLIMARNGSFERDTLGREGGAVAYAAALPGAPAILGGWDWWPDPGTQRMVLLTAAGDLLKDDGTGAFATTLTAGLPAVPPVFVEGGKEAAANARKLFLFTGGAAVQVLADDGAATANLATPPADWAAANQPRFGFNHEGRLTGAGNLNDPHRWYWSTATDHEDFGGAGSGSLPIYPGEGERLICGFSFKKLAILLKAPRGVYAVDTSDPSTANWKVYRVGRAAGGIAPLGYTLFEEDAVFLDANGHLHLLSAVTEYGNVKSSSLTEALLLAPFLRDEVNLQQLALAQMVFYAHKRELHIALPAATRTVNNRRLVFDVAHGLGNIRPRWSDRDTCPALWLRKDTDGVERPVLGDDAGVVWRLDQDAKDKGGASYLSEFQTGHDDFAWANAKLATRRKHGAALELVGERLGSFSVFVDLVWDGNLRETVAYNFGVSGSAIGVFTLGSSALGGESVLNVKHRIHGGGRRLSLILRNNGVDEDFSVARAFLSLKAGDDRRQAAT